MRHKEIHEFSCPTSERIEQMSNEIAELAATMGAILEKWDQVMEHVVNTLNNRTPEGSVPMKTHVMVVRGLITGFSIVVVVAVGAVKFAPLVLEVISK